MHRIEIDDEVYAALAAQASGFETPNDVLRRALRLGVNEVPAASARPTVSSIPGALAGLLEAGVVKPGDQLRHVQVRKGNAFTGTVEADGWITTAVSRYSTPSPALSALVGTSIDGWAYWTHEPSGKTLRQLRTEIGGRGKR